MKNIHVLPTEMPSRLYYNKLDKTYQLCEFHKYHTDIKSTHNIYIIFDEEIKEGDWYLNGNGFFKCDNSFAGTTEIKYGSPLLQFNKKIILTTDSDLINDGVQSIDDNFLEWFVKNQSCEEVEIEAHWYKETNETEYKIIIPKEDREIDSCKYFDEEVGCVQTDCKCEKIEHKGKSLTAEEVMEGRSNAYEFINFDETVEEAAEKEFPLMDTEWCLTRACEEENLQLLGHRTSFINGAKWQADKMYTEEDLFTRTLEAVNIGMILRQNQLNGWSYESGNDAHKEWFEKFKK